MATTMGMTFTVGARLQSTVGSVFSTLEGRIKTLKGDLRMAKNVATVSGKLNAAKASLTMLKAQANAGEDVRKKIQSASLAFTSAQRTAARYNITVKDSAHVHALATAQIERTEIALKRQEVYQRNRAKRSELKGQIMGTIASVTAVAAPVHMAMKFQTAMADATKTLEGMHDSTGKTTQKYKEIEEVAFALGREIPVTHEKIAETIAVFGQQGVKTAEDFKELTKLAGHSSVAFGQPIEAMAEKIGNMRNQLGLSIPETRKAMDLMVQYANTTGAKGQSILGIVGTVASLGKVAGVSSEQLTAMAATLSSVGVDESSAGTGLKNFLLALSSGEAATTRQTKALAKLGFSSKGLAQEMQKDSGGAIVAILSSIKALDKAEQASTLNELFGSGSVLPISTMLDNLEKLKNNLDLAGREADYSGAMFNEFKNRNKGAETAIIMAKNATAELAITLGQQLCPTVESTANSVANTAKTLTDLAKEYPAVTLGIMGTVGGLAAFKVAGLAVKYTMTTVSDALTFVSGAVSLCRKAFQRSTYSMMYQSTVTMALAAKTKILSIAQWMLNVAMTANPIGLVIAGVAVLGSVLYGLYQTCQPFREFLDSLWDGFLIGLKPVISTVEWLWNKIKKIINWFGDDNDKKVDEKANKEIAERENAKQQESLTVRVRNARIAPVMQPPKLLAESVGATTITNTMPQSTSYLPDISSLTGSFGGANVSIPQGSASTSIVQNLSLNITVEGITDNDFGKRVIESIEEKKTRLQKIFDDLLHDANRRAYS